MHHMSMFACEPVPKCDPEKDAVCDNGILPEKKLAEKSSRA